jgi:tripartite-type tricarboxylate transporter receptor subunit TctC
MSAPERSSFFPEVPTFRELGYDVAIGVWRTLAAPKTTPQPILDKLTGALHAAMQTPALKADFAKVQLTVDYLDPAAARARAMEEYAQFGKLFTAMGINVKTKS